MPNPTSTSEDLPADNAARIAIYDVLADAPWVEEFRRPALAEDELFGRVVGRLRILVPRELHLLGEREYVRNKINACVEDGIVERVPETDLLALTGTPPRVRYPDGKIQPYEAGLEGARERLEFDDSKLRQRGIDFCRLLPSLADEPKSDGFQALVSSMRERDYLKQFPPTVGADGVVVDGRARIAAAEIAGVKVGKSEVVPRRWDTPLHRVLLALDVNWNRLSDDQRQLVYAEIASQAGRKWSTIADDLERTRAWRRATPRPYIPTFEVKKVTYRHGGVPNVQVTPDGKVMLRSLLEAAGLSNYKIKYLRGYVVEEEAKTTSEAGSSGSRRSPVKAAIFVRIVDAIPAIENMQRDRRLKNRLVEKEWDDIRKWLVDHSPGRRQNRAPDPRADLSHANSGAEQQRLV
jgi:hypothetical protein